LLILVVFCWCSAIPYHGLLLPSLALGSLLVLLLILLMLDHPGTNQVFTLKLYITLRCCHRYHIAKLVAVSLIPEAAQHRLEFHLACNSITIPPYLQLDWNFTLPITRLQLHLACNTITTSFSLRKPLPSSPRWLMNGARRAQL
jgi:hypothetical protein